MLETQSTSGTTESAEDYESDASDFQDILFTADEVFPEIDGEEGAFLVKDIAACNCKLIEGQPCTPASTWSNFTTCGCSAWR
ncbi:hypothetical protein PoB_004296100 [Plakobranchus ocellatus]|uniref:Uncharacterized protein n=1 Tax=Plakobranchus ocellatus TaxID=259542 RepID=A0AAV4BC94_9GAST|nr:hypothetical protein PoB_004296100 [Plakobranchus ocellatus]